MGPKCRTHYLKVTAALTFTKQFHSRKCMVYGLPILKNTPHCFLLLLSSISVPLQNPKIKFCKNKAFQAFVLDIVSASVSQSTNDDHPQRRPKKKKKSRGSLCRNTSARRKKTEKMAPRNGSVLKRTGSVQILPLYIALPKLIKKG